MIRIKKKQKFDIKQFIEKSELPVITVTIDGVKHNMLVDSGSDASYIDKNALKEMNKELIGHQNGIVGGTSIDENQTNVYEINFTCGNKELKEEFTENDFNQIFTFIKQNSGVKLTGILGTRFLIKHKCILDFDKLTFHI